MSTITTRAGKGSPLTNNELDSNFTNLNADKVEIGGDLSGTPTAPIVTKVQGQNFSTDVPNVGEKLVWNGTAWEPATDPSGEPIGHEDKSQSSISFNTGTRTFTISPVSANFVVWCKGVKHTYTSAQTVVIPDTTGLHFIYFNASGVLSTQMSYFTWEEHAPTAYIYWNATTQQAVYFGDERHGITLDWQTHEYLHRTRGAAIASGFGASGYTTTGAGATDADAQIDIGGGTFFDEDLQVDIVSTNTPVAGTWQQDLSGPARIPVIYLSGSAWVIDAPTNFPFKVVSGVPQYNLLSGSTWSTAPVTNNEYFVTWILATHNLTYPVISVIGQAQTNNISAAESMTFEGLTLPGFPSVEFRPLYKIIYQYKTSYANTVKVSTIAVYDIRSISAAGVAAALVQDHGNLSGLGDDDHAQYLHVSSVRSPSAAVTNSFLPSQASQSGKYLTTDGSNPSWGTIPSGSLTFTGDVTGTGNTGSSTTLTLANSGVTAGTFTKVTVDAKGRVTNGASASSSDITTALGFTPENVANKAVANGYASLDSSGKVPSNQLPSYVDDVLEYANLAAFPGTGETGKIYIAIDTVKTYRWSGSAYVEITSSPGSTDAVTEGSTNLYFTNARARAAVSASGSLSYSTATGIFSYTQPTNVSAFTNDSGYLTGITGAQVTTALGYTPPQPNGTGATGTWSISISGNAATVSSITSAQVTAALGYTPYNATNPAGYTTNVGTVTSVSGTGTVSGLTLTGSVTSSGSLTLGGTLSLTSGQVTSALGYTPYNATNPSGYITSSALSSYLPLSGGTLTGTLYFTDTTNGIYKAGGRLTVRSESTDDVANFASYGLYLPKTGQTAGLYVQSPIEARGGLRIGDGAGSGTITVGADTAATANRLVQRDSSGDIYGRYFFGVHFNQSSSNTENPSIAAFWTNSGSDNYNRKSSPAHVISQLGLVTTSNYSSYALPLSGGTVSGATNFSSGITVNNTSADGRGINLYSGSPTSPTYGLFFAQTGNFGTYGAVSADWATYFTMNSTAHRGWIFREHESLGNVAAISNQGNMTIRSHFEQGNNIARPNVSWSASSTSTGMVIFYLPGTTSNYGMVHMVFDIYEYNSPRVATVIVGGHNWSTSWYNTGCNVVGYTDKQVRVGVKDGRFVVVFGTSGSSWSYGTIVLRKIHNGSFYDNIMNMVGDWSATQTTTESFTSVSGDLRGLRTPSTMEVDGILYGYNSIRSDIFYDNNNTSYYIDGASTSRLNELQSDRTYGFTDIRSPIFYDYNNTGYYCDPASSSRLSTIYCGDVYNDLGGWFRNYGATGIYNQSYGNHFYSDSANYWNVGIGGQTSGGIRFRDSHAGTVRGYVYVDNGNNIGFLNSSGSWRARVVADDYFLVDGSSARAPIFYDSNDTGYYCDPNSTSQFNQARFVNRIAVGNGSTPYLNTGTAGIWFSNSGGASHFAGSHDSDTSWWGVYTNSAWRSWLTGGGSWISTGDQRAPIFYDYNDTGYYCNPNDWSLLWGLSTYYIRNNYDVSADHPFGLYFNAGLSNAYAIYRESGPWTNPFPDLRIAFHTGIKIGANSGYQGVRFYTDYDMSSQVMSVNNGSDPLGGGNVYVNSALQAGGSLRAPIFYDSADTGYYLDHTSATSLRTVGDWRSDSGPWSGEFAGKIQYHSSIWYFQAATGWQFRNSVGSQLMYVDSSGNATFNGNVTAYSDRRLKDNVRDLTGAKAYLNKISAKRFTWKDDGYEDIGFIAQDVEAAGLTEFVLETADYDPNTETTSDPVKSLDYGRMVSVLWQAVKEQELQISSMSDEIKSLKERLQ